MSDKNMAENFLFFNYFGVTMADCNWDNIINISLKKSYFDATNQRAYNALFKKDYEELKDKKKEVKVTANKYLKERIEELMFNCADKNINFDDWHKETCEELVKKYESINKRRKEKEKGKVFFSCGNAQKWVNMALKYIYILDSLQGSQGSKYHSQIEKYKYDFHIPIDSYILEGIWYMQDCDIFDCSEVKKAFPTSNGNTSDENTSDGNKKEANCYGNIKPWSQWDDYDEYKKFQSVVKKCLIKEKKPLEWEDEVWIIVAAYRKKVYSIDERIPKLEEKSKEELIEIRKNERKKLKENLKETLKNYLEQN